MRRFEDVFRTWGGAALALVGVIATLWLAATGRLTLYVHPRYTLLTVIMAVLTLLVLVGMAAVGVSSAADEDGDHDHVTRMSAFGRLLIWCNGAVLICAALALLVIPPATLSSTARQNRELVTSGQVLDSTKVRGSGRCRSGNVLGQGLGRAAEPRRSGSGAGQAGRCLRLRA